MVKNQKYPPFSVLMTVYKKENPVFLDLALKSIEDQSLMPNEIVLVEDGTLTEGLEKIVLQHENSFKGLYKVIRYDVNHGRGYASRIGLKHVRNDWIARMDSDDISVKNRFEMQLNAIVKDPEIRMIGSQILEFEDNINNVKGGRFVPLTNGEIKSYAKFRSPINNPTIMFNKRSLEIIGGYPKLNVMEDYDLCVSFLIHGQKVINLPNALVNMRVSNNMYKRRGGIKYLAQYIQLKNKWRKDGIGNFGSVFLSDLAMVYNVALPNWVRKRFYENILHKNKG